MHYSDAVALHSLTEPPINYATHHTMPSTKQLKHGIRGFDAEYSLFSLNYGANWCKTVHQGVQRMIL